MMNIWAAMPLTVCIELVLRIDGRKKLWLFTIPLFRRCWNEFSMTALFTTSRLPSLSERDRGWGQREGWWLFVVGCGLFLFVHLWHFKKRLFCFSLITHHLLLTTCFVHSYPVFSLLANGSRLSAPGYSPHLNPNRRMIACLLPATNFFVYTSGF